jgi:hypothetical protein
MLVLLVSSTNKTDHNKMTKIVLKVVLNTYNPLIRDNPLYCGQDLRIYYFYSDYFLN